MPLARGQSAHQEVAEAAKANRGSGWARVLVVKSGEKFLARFRGFTRPLPLATEEQLQEKTLGELREFCRRWGVYEKVEEGDAITALVERLLDRQKHYEPVTITEDYIHAPGGGIRRYTTCSKQWDGSPCVRCQLRDQGDRRISPKVSTNFSIVPRRLYHYVKGNNKNDNEFAYCARHGYNASQRCQYCARNIEAKQEGMKRFSIASSHAQGVFACAERMAKRCAACKGFGTINHIEWTCEACGELLNGVSEGGWGDDVRCGQCGHTGHPYEEVTCSQGCVTARRAQLFDADILVERMGADKKTQYSFTEQLPFEPAPEEILKFRVPTWEIALKPKDIPGQCRDTNLQVNPFTNERIGPQGPAAAAESYDENAGGEGTYDEPANDVQY